MPTFAPEHTSLTDDSITEVLDGPTSGSRCPGFLTIANPTASAITVTLYIHDGTADRMIVPPQTMSANTGGYIWEGKHVLLNGHTLRVKLGSNPSSPLDCYVTYADHF